MSAPQNPQDFPQPSSAFAGSATRANPVSKKLAKAWQPKGTSLENLLATLSRYALRVIDRRTGEAYSADELADGGLAAASSITHGRLAVAGGVLAIPITHRYVAKTTGGVEALTLANGAFIGQRINIRLVTDGGNGTLTPTTKTGFATVVFEDAGDFVELEWTADGWIIIAAGGLTAQPTITV